MVSPRELGLPFENWRRGQWEALDRISQSQRKVFILQGPTGTGKSLIGIGLHKLLGKKTVYLATTKQLQDQIVDTFPEAVELKGRANYPTRNFPKRFPWISCEACKKDGHCPLCCPGGDGEGCAGRFLCPYVIQKRKAQNSPLTILNTSFFLNEVNFVGGFSGIPLVVADEADLLENELMKHVEVKISDRIIKSYGLGYPDRKTVVQAWKEWGQGRAIPILEAALKYLDEGTADGLKKAEEIRRILHKIQFLVEDVDEGKWVFMDGDGVRFKPVFVNRYVEKFFWRHGEKFLLMSATIISPEQMARDLGIEDWEFLDIPSTFPPERRPIYYIPIANMSRKNWEFALPKIVDGLDRILRKNNDKKVLVHTVSFHLAEFVLRNSGEKERMISYREGEREEVIQTFKSSPKPLALVAPSFERGVDLPHDTCRIVVVLKVPYPDLGDKQVSARVYGSRDGDRWYAVNTIRNLVQATGRGMRSEDDWCITYILDEEFGRLYRNWWRFFPSWWREALHLPYGG